MQQQSRINNAHCTQGNKYAMCYFFFLFLSHPVFQPALVISKGCAHLSKVLAKSERSRRMFQHWLSKLIFLLGTGNGKQIALATYCLMKHPPSALNGSWMDLLRENADVLPYFYNLSPLQLVQDVRQVLL